MKRPVLLAAFALAAALLLGVGGGEILFRPLTPGERTAPPIVLSERSESKDPAEEPLTLSERATPPLVLSERSESKDGPSTPGLRPVGQEERWVWLDDEHTPPPYPWPDPEDVDETPLERLDSHKLDANWSATPARVALASICEAASVPLAVMPEVAERLRTTKIELRLRDITAHNVLSIVIDSVDGTTWILRRGVVTIIPKDKEDDPDWKSDKEPERPLVPSRLFADSPRRITWVDMRRLDRRMTYDFEDTPLNEVVQFFDDFLDVPFAISRAIDGDEMKFTDRRQEISGRAALDHLVEVTGLQWRRRHGAILIEPRESDDPPEHDVAPSLGDTPLSFELPSASVPGLVAELQRHSIPVIASRRAWESRGTFSLFARDELLGCVASRLSKQRALAMWIEYVGGHETVLIDGEVPSVRAALDVAAVSSDAAPLHAKLLDALERREPLRRGPFDKKTLRALDKTEASVRDAAGQLLALRAEEDERAHADEERARKAPLVAEARATCDQLAAELERATRAAREVEVTGLADRIDAAYDELGKAAQHLAAAKHRLDELEATPSERRARDE